jgi:hypothetical protein
MRFNSGNLQDALSFRVLLHGVGEQINPKINPVVIR